MRAVSIRAQYQALLRYPQWQKRRLQILERDNWTCQECQATDRELQIHHRWYVPNAEPWKISDAGLVTLCVICHEGKSMSRHITEQGWVNGLTGDGFPAPLPILGNYSELGGKTARIPLAEGDNGRWYLRIEDLEEVSEQVCLERYQEIKRFHGFVTYEEQGRGLRAEWNKKLGPGKEGHVHFTTEQEGYAGTWAIIDLGLAFAGYIDSAFGAEIVKVYRQVETGIFHADEQRELVSASGAELSLAHIAQIGQALTALAIHQQEQGQEIVLARRDAGEAKHMASQAVALAAHAVENQRWWTIEEYIKKNHLTRQLPPGTAQSMYGRWLTGYCAEHGIPVRPVGLIGRVYDTVGSYPGSVIDETLPGYLKNIQGQGGFGYQIA